MRDAMNSGKLQIKQEQIKSIFSDIEVICNYNSLLLADLEPCLADWSPNQRLGHIFLTIVCYLSSFLFIFIYYYFFIVTHTTADQIFESLHTIRERL
jgi:hypothetical protein